MKKIFLILSLLLCNVTLWAHEHGHDCDGHHHEHEHSEAEHKEDLDSYLDSLDYEMQGEIEEVNVGGVRSTLNSKMNYLGGFNMKI